MGYDDRLLTSTCKGCGARWLFRRQPNANPFRKWVCDKCKGTNIVNAPPTWPEVPRTVFIGADNNRLLKLLPVPPERHNEPWARPYGVRSVLYQASRTLGGCSYSCSLRGTVYGENVYFDQCHDPNDQDFEPDERDCHVLAGWSAGQATCPLFDGLAALCQTDVERKFLSTYFRYVKDRDFPVLIPQARIGIAERRRVDFVLYVPLQYWRFKWLAVELDGAHPEDKAEDDAARDRYYGDQGYEVISLRPGARGYFEEVRVLAERVEVLMKMAQTDEWDVALEVPVTRFEPPAWEPPF